MKKSYYAIIPANVRYDDSLIDGAKLLYGEITALCNQEGYCWASNSYFSELYGVSKVTISKWINQLKEKGYIDSRITYKEGSKEIDKRYLTILNDPIKEKLNTPIKEKFKDNNTVINNTSNKDIVEIINYLNRVADKKYRHTTKAHQRHIKARLREGFIVDDFKKVIDIKATEWKNDKNMNQYLRPETLFGTKFESYLNQNMPVKQKGEIDLDQFDLDD